MNIANTHPSWKPLIAEALREMDVDYLNSIDAQKDWLPGPELIFNAFSHPVSKIRYILMGESPYPRKESANGYAFWDNAVSEIWSRTGLSTPVNRATSLRNMIKMLLVARGDLQADNTAQSAICAVNKTALVQTIEALFSNFNYSGFVLLNASLVFRQGHVTQDTKAWLPFMVKMIEQLYTLHPQIELILFGKMAEKIGRLEQLSHVKRLCAEHPYNLSFIQNKSVLDYFKPLRLLDKR